MNAEFSSDEIEKFAVLLEPDSDSTITELLSQWPSCVTDVEQGYYGAPEDYWNDVWSRYKLELLLRRSKAALNDKLAAVLAPLDQRFAAATITTEKSVTDFSAEFGVNPSWAARLPNRLSPKIAELKQYWIAEYPPDYPL